MKKSETIHVRIDSKTKKKAELILDKLGLNLSYAISLYLKQIINKKRIPFEISIDDDSLTKEEEIMNALNITGGKEIDNESKRIIKLYSSNQIDYETAVFALNRRYIK